MFVLALLSGNLLLFPVDIISIVETPLLILIVETSGEVSFTDNVKQVL
jgi:hypothetical protein